jgi:hypothetical protein
MSEQWLRRALGVIGIALTGYGILRILQLVHGSQLFGLVIWLVGGLAIHDGLLAPAVIGIGLLLRRFLPERPRAFVQAALVTGGLISSVGLVLIWRRGKTSAPSLALLDQNYLSHLILLLGLVGGAVATGYLWTESRAKRTKSRASADQ